MRTTSEQARRKEAKPPTTPGEYLRQLMAIDQLSAKTLSKTIKCHAQTIYNITNSSDPQKISHRMALKLSGYFGHTTDFWLQDTLEPGQIPSPRAAAGSGVEADLEQLSGGGLLVDHEINALLDDTQSGLEIIPHNPGATQSVSYDLTYGLSIKHGYKKLRRPEWRMVHTKEFNPDGLEDWERDFIETKLEALREKNNGSTNDHDKFDFAQGPVPLKQFESVRVLAREHLNFGIQYAAFVGGTTRNSMDGLLVVPGLQVDPGYRGPMFFFITNLDSETVTLVPGQKLATLAILKLGNKPTKAYEREVEERMRKVANGIRKKLIDIFRFDELKYSRGVKVTFGADIIETTDTSAAQDLEDAHFMAIRWLQDNLSSENEGLRDRLTEAVQEVLDAVALDREAAKLVGEYLGASKDKQAKLLKMFEGPSAVLNISAKTAFDKLDQNAITAFQAILAD